LKSQENTGVEGLMKQQDHVLNRGLALLVLITFSIVGASWLFSLPVYFDAKIAAQVFPVIFSLILFISVTKLQNIYLNKIAAVSGFIFAFTSWSFVIYLNTVLAVSADPVVFKDALHSLYLGKAYSMYLLGMCLLIIWLGHYFRYSLYLSLVLITIFLIALLVFSGIEIVYLLSLALILISSTVLTAIGLNNATFIPINKKTQSFNETLNNEFILPSELDEQELKPELDINVQPLGEENALNYDWELILRELQGELKNTTDVDQLFKRMLVFLHGAMDFNAAAVGMLQEKSIRKIASIGDDEYLHPQAVNWTNQRIKKLFSQRESLLSMQTHKNASTSSVHRLDVPVISNAKVVGLVSFFREDLIFNTHDVKLSSSIVFHSMLALRLSRLQDEVKRLSSESAETRLTVYSREQFVTKVKPVFEKMSRPRECSLFIVEIDSLDQVIDKQGRDAGSLLRKTISKTIMSYLSDRDIIGRYGNEGFVILLDETDLMHAKSVAEKIRLKASQVKVKYQGNVLTTTVSIGLTIVSDPDDDLPSLMRKADMGLFVAKENGNNSIKVSL